ncbi:hypothetical protein WR25_22337 [Diploscapter pachys]|uniref:Uncharacterized protein n=1 Tax=Diploscapter pachys TaxID=2018661 RepID=A0A2A2LBL0_9BILA|nr:hypothetical protein WR25_22337 [Diploscapter pachys]
MENPNPFEIVIIEGALRDPKTNQGKDVIKEAIENKRLWVNADAYIVRCKKNKAIVWEKPFPGMRDITKEKNTVAEAKDIEEFDDFGRKLKMKPRKMPDRYSIDILGFDSTARSMFFRHLPRTVDTMNKLGYHFFYGYNKNWTYGPCKDGDQIQKEFVDLWYRFAHKYKDICHFGFTFVTTLTHEVGLTLETLDEYLAGRLAQLHLSGALDNSLSIIMGDHGNRIGLQQYSYSGRIEERMPLMAIRLPNNFAKTYPTEYGHFIKNKYKLVSNFDVHQMLKDIALMRLGKSDVSREGRGISLFTEIPRNRTCREAYIAYNFCMCLIDQSNVTKPYKNRESKSKEERTKVAKIIENCNSSGELEAEFGFSMAKNPP